MRRIISVAALLLVVTACSSTTTTPTYEPGGSDRTTIPVTATSSSGETTTVVPSTSTTAVFLPDMPAATPGAAWMGGFGCGVTVLDADGTWHGLREETSALRTDQVFDVVGTPSGRVYITGSLGVWEVEGDLWTEIDRKGLESLAVGPDGTLWGAGWERVLAWSNGAGTEYPSTLFGEGDNTQTVKDVAVGPDGVVWVTTANTVARFDGSTWDWWGNGAGFPESTYPYWPESIAVGNDGTVWVTHGSGVLRFDGSSWADIDPVSSQPKGIVVAPDGRVIVDTWADGLAVFDGSWSMITTAGPLPTDRTRAAFVDGRDRLWVGTTWGVTIIDGDDVVTYTMATSGLAGNCVDTIWVDGDGPELPDTTEPVTGSLAGSVTLSGAPHAGKRVVVCSEQPSPIFSGEHPCEGFPIGMVTITDADGRFFLGDIPIGDYDIAWEVEEGSWKFHLIGGDPPVVREGQTTTLDPVELAGD